MKKINYKDYIWQLQQQIEECATSEKQERVMWEQLEDIEDKLFELEMEIEEQYEIKAQENEPSDYELAEAFNYACRI